MNTAESHPFDGIANAVAGLFVGLWYTIVGVFFTVLAAAVLYCFFCAGVIAYWTVTGEVPFAPPIG